MPCSLCELPDADPADGFLFLWPPQAHTLHKLASRLAEQGTAFDNLARDNCLRIATCDAPGLLRAVSAALTDMERADTRVLLTPRRGPDLSDYGRVSTFDRAVEIADGAWVMTLLREGRYRSVAQPIVSARPDAGVRGHEFLLRAHGVDGEAIMPDRLFRAARDPQTFFNLDRAARLCAVEASIRIAGDLDIFINFMPGSVYDPGVCLRTTVDRIVALGIDPARVVFEVVESDSIRDLAHLASIVDFYREAGFRIALDDFGTGSNNLAALMALKPNLIKLDKCLMPDNTGDRRRMGLVGAVVRDCHENGIDVLAEGVETEEQARLMREAGIDLMQGYHFGAPRELE